MIGKIVFSDENEIDFIDPNKINQVARVKYDRDNYLWKREETYRISRLRCKT